MSEELLVRSADDLFTDVCADETRLAAERDGWAAELWSAIAVMGLPWISVPEAAGGQGGQRPAHPAVGEVLHAQHHRRQPGADQREAGPVQAHRPRRAPAARHHPQRQAERESRRVTY